MNKKNAIIEQYGEKMFLGYIPQIKGLVVEGESEKEVLKELSISLKVKIAYDYNLKI